jgi:SAM-dependent methyltransferase
MALKDWLAWHDAYDRPGSQLSRRLAAVQDRVRIALDTSPPGPLRVISLCAGQGRDLIEVLADHPRRDAATALLVELDARNVAYARTAAARAGLGRVEVREADAAALDEYAALVPADLVLLCGIFGNVTPADIARTVAHAPQLTATGGMVIWTRHRDDPDLVPRICDWFVDAGFAQIWVSAKDDGYGVGVHRHTGAPPPLERGVRLFSFERV